MSRIEHDRAGRFPEIKLLSEKIGNQRPDGIKLPTKGSYDEQNSLERKSFMISTSLLRAYAFVRDDRSEPLLWGDFRGFIRLKKI